MKNNFLTAVSRNLGKTKLAAKKHAPTIMLITGAVGVVAAAVLACKETLEAKDIIDEHSDELNEIKQAREEKTEEVYTPADYRSDLGHYYISVGGKVVLTYMPSVILGSLSLASMIGSNVILRKRNASLAAAYATLSGMFASYRKNVVDNFGEAVDHNMRYGVKTVKVEEEITDPETGKTKKIKVAKDVANVMPGDYARFFDEDNPYFQCDAVTGRPHHDANITWLKCKQAYANDMLKIRGYLFLNDVYDMLGFARVKDGQSIGWIYDKDNPNDNFIDFGIFNTTRPNQRFINGYEDVLLLDFNYDGDILNSPLLKLATK
jgi:hypothetical protein